YAGLKRHDDTIVHAHPLRQLDVAERKDIFVEEALLRQGAKQSEAVAVEMLDLVIDGLLQQAAADRGQQAFQLEVMDDLRLQQCQQHGLARHRARAVSSEQF